MANRIYWTTLSLQIIGDLLSKMGLPKKKMILKPSYALFKFAHIIG